MDSDNRKSRTLVGTAKEVGDASEESMEYWFNRGVSDVEEGEVVQAGAPVVTIGDVKSPLIVLFVPEPRIASLRIGAPVSVRIDGGRQYSGVVEEINRNLEFTPRFLFSERERPNLVMRARVRVADADGALHAGAPAFVTLR